MAAEIVRISLERYPSRTILFADTNVDHPLERIFLYNKTMKINRRKQTNFECVKMGTLKYPTRSTNNIVDMAVSLVFEEKRKFAYQLHKSFF